jgi:ferric-dicitrate binding protein FerR (iron transport regulator)
MLHDRTWFLLGRKMTGEARPEELRELEEILKNDPELYFSLHAIAELWHRNPPDTSADLQEAYQAHLQRMKDRGIPPPADLTTPGEQDDSAVISPSRSIPTTRMLIGFISVSLIAFVIYVTAALVIPQPKPGRPAVSEIFTPRGSRTSITLPDSTIIRLNSGSTLSYGKNYSDKVRELTLNGEAWFHVTRKMSKPLVIRTAAVDITVAGTEFNLKAYPEDLTTEVILLEGELEATLNHMKGRKINMQPAEKLTLRNAAPASGDSLTSASRTGNETLINLVQIYPPAADTSIPELAWLKDILVFNNVPFADLASSLAKWYGVDFVFEDHSLDSLTFSGHFADQPITGILDTLSFPGRFRFRVDQNTVFISRP